MCYRRQSLLPPTPPYPSPWYGPPYLSAPSLHPPGGAALPAPAAPPSASGWGGSHSRCLVFPPPSALPCSPPPPGPDTVGLFREAGRSSPLNRWISHVFGHFRPSRRKLPKWWRNLTALSEGWAEIAEPAAELAEGLKGRGTETRRRRLLAPEPAESSRSSPALLRLQRGEKRPQPARARTVTTRPLPVLRRK